MKIIYFNVQYNVIWFYNEYICFSEKTFSMSKMTVVQLSLQFNVYNFIISSIIM